MDDLRERAEEIADYAVGERHNDGMYQRVADMALKELRAAVEAERKKNEFLNKFHDAWIACEVAHATGDPDLAKEHRGRVVAAHKAIRRRT